MLKNSEISLFWNSRYFVEKIYLFCQLFSLFFKQIRKVFSYLREITLLKQPRSNTPPPSLLVTVGWRPIKYYTGTKVSDHLDGRFNLSVYVRLLAGEPKRLTWPTKALLIHQYSLGYSCKYEFYHISGRRQEEVSRREGARVWEFYSCMSAPTHNCQI